MVTRVSPSPSIRKWVDRINGEVFGRAVPCRIESFEKPGSTIARVSFDDPRRNYYVKVKRPQLRLNPNPELTARALEQEYANLCALSHIRDRQFLTPRPLLSDADRMILASSELPGSPLHKRYPRIKRLIPRWDKSICRDLYQIGQALRSLHETDLPCPEVQAGEYAHQFEQNRTDPIMPLTSSLRTALDIYAREIENNIREIRDLKTCHNDFTAYNVLISGNRIGMLDLDGLGRNRPERDFATFYVSLLDLLAHVPGASSRHDRWWNGFCSGYGEVISVERMFPFLVHALTNHLLELAVRHRNCRSYLRRLYYRRLMAVSKRELNSLLSVL